MIRVVEIDCWHSNELIYQASGRTDDGRFAYVRYRRPWFTVGIAETEEASIDADTVILEIPALDPCRIDRKTLAALTHGEVEWPKIDGFDNEE